MTTILVVLALAAAAIGLVRVLSFLKRRAAAVNLVLAKATFLALSPDKQAAVHDTAVNQLNELMGGRFTGFNGEYDRFGCYAHAMARLDISPIIKGYCYPLWYMVKNPLTDIFPSDPLIDRICDDVREKHGVTVTISREHALFDRIKAAAGKASDG